MRYIILKRGFAVAGFSAMLMLVGCTTYQQQNMGIVQKWRSGDVQGAVAQFGEKAEREKNTKDAIIWRLEHATALRAAQQYKESNAAFDEAEQKIVAYDEGPKVKVAHEAAATLSNQANLDYEGRFYDKIMVSTYKALNDLQLGDYEKARVDFNRAYKWQEDAVAANAKRIEKAQQEASKDKETIDKVQQDPKFKKQVDDLYGGLNTFKPYGDYVNPFAIYMDALYFMTANAGSSDLEHASKSFERMAALAGDNKFVKQDQQAIKDLMAGHPLPPTTYVIFETGGAPVRDQIRIDIPIFLPKVPYVGAAFPKLAVPPDYVPQLTVTANGATETTAIIGSMDSVVAHEFKDELPTIITKTIISTVAKAAAAYAINDAAAGNSGSKKKKNNGQNNQSGNDQLAGALFQLGTAIYQAAVNIADLRTWTTLPKEFQVCRVPTPADRKIELATVTGQKVPVTVGDGNINIIYVRSISSRAPLLVSQAKLR